MTRPRADASLVHLVVPGVPCTKNARHGHGHGRVFNSKRYLAWRKQVCAAATLERIEPWFCSRGRWTITVRTYWPDVSARVRDVRVPNGDSDAVLSCAKDALGPKGACILDDDARIVADQTENFIDENEPRVEILLRRLKGGA